MERFRTLFLELELWHRYTTIKNIKWPDNKASALDRKSKDVLIDMCNTFSISNFGDKKELYYNLIEYANQEFPTSSKENK